jgi:hypothetical protein
LKFTGGGTDTFFVWPEPVAKAYEISFGLSMMELISPNSYGSISLSRFLRAGPRRLLFISSIFIALNTSFWISEAV